MDEGDFEFPPDHIEDGLGAPLPPAPLSVSALVHTPVEHLPPTGAPLNGAERRTLGQTIRGHTAALARPPPPVRGGGVAEVRAAADGASDPPHTAAAMFGHDAAPEVDEFALDIPALAGVGAPVPAAPPRVRVSWSAEEVRRFYRALSHYGTDFAAISVLFPKHSRVDVKRLYHRELRRNAPEVRSALSQKEEIDLESFSELLKERQLREAPPKKKLNAAEEDGLKLIAASFGDIAEEFAIGDDNAFSGDAEGGAADASAAAPPVKRQRGETSPKGAKGQRRKSGSTGSGVAPPQNGDGVEETLFETALRQQKEDNQTFAEAALNGEFGSFDDFNFD